MVPPATEATEMWQKGAAEQAEADDQRSPLDLERSAKTPTSLLIAIDPALLRLSQAVVDFVMAADSMRTLWDR